ncbi:MAG TPA: DUF6777 domain-containing protein [Pseudonocardia sp.]
MNSTGFQTPSGGQDLPAYDPSMYGPPPRNPKRRDPSKRTQITVMVAIVVALAAVIGGVAAAVKPTKASASSVRLEPTSFAGASPFVSPVGTDQAGVVAPAKTGGEFSGATAGLYSRNPEAPSCDGQTLVAALQADDQKATAWASALSIQAADIPGFVSKLTPVVLRSDTSVTVFGYDAGTYFPYPAVLQAGTAVFINSYGEPTVKCYSGNPLASRAVPSGGTTVAASYVGPSWGSFSSSSVTVVRPSTIVNQTFCTGGNATGGTTTGGTTTGGAPGSTTTGGNTTGGTTIGGAGCVITGGGAGPILDCKKNQQLPACQPTTTPPVTNPTPTIPCDPGPCTTTPGETTKPGETTTPGETTKQGETTTPGGTTTPGETTVPAGTIPCDPGPCTTTPGETTVPGQTTVPGGTTAPIEGVCPDGTVKPAAGCKGLEALTPEQTGHSGQGKSKHHQEATNGTGQAPVVHHQPTRTAKQDTAQPKVIEAPKEVQEPKVVEQQTAATTEGSTN